MSLEKWIKSPKDKDKESYESKEKKPQKNEKKPHAEVSDKNQPELKVNKIPGKKFSKYVLVCPKKSCGYQKTLMKQQLTDKDKTCPRCKSIMKIAQV